jgi:predicted adenylyl cyclase CyaB
MKRVTFEFKARLRNEGLMRAALKKVRARYVGTDHQVDTYFRVRRGRLKLRQGRIENALIYYERPESPRARRAQIEIVLLPRRNSVKAILARVLSLRAVVDKHREIYFVGNVKIHLDRVRGLGKLVEVEALSRSGRLAKIRQQAQKFQKLFGVAPSDLVGQSYSDLAQKKLNH